MDLLSIIGKVWRYKLITIPIIILTALGALYIVKVKAPVYQATSGILLVNPPAPPTAEQIAKDPSLGNVNTNNTFAGFGNLDVVADAVIRVVDTESAQLVQAGANPQFQLSLSSDLGQPPPPIIEVTGIAPNAQEALASANLVSKAVMNSLHQMQAQQGINPSYMIKSVEIYSPQNAQESSSGKLRTLIALLAAGIIVIFIAISMIDAFKRRRDDLPNEVEQYRDPANEVKLYNGLQNSSRSNEVKVHSDLSDGDDHAIFGDDSTMAMPRVFSPPDRRDRKEDS